MMSRYFLSLWHYSLLGVTGGSVLFVLASKDFAVALNGIGGMYTLALWPTILTELGVVWLTAKRSKSWMTVPVKKRKIVLVPVLLIFLGLFVATVFTRSFVEDAITALYLSFWGASTMLLSLLIYRDHLATLSQK